MMLYANAILRALANDAPLSQRDLVERLGGNDRQAFDRIGAALGGAASCGPGLPRNAGAGGAAAVLLLLAGECRMIRFLDAAGLAQPIYAVEVDGQTYTPAEVAAIVAVHSSDEGANVCVRGLHRTKDRLCEVPDCGEPVTGMSRYCKKHDRRFKRHGDPSITLRPWDVKKGKM